LPLTLGAAWVLAGLAGCALIEVDKAAPAKSAPAPAAAVVAPAPATPAPAAVAPRPLVAAAPAAPVRAGGNAFAVAPAASAPAATTPSSSAPAAPAAPAAAPPGSPPPFATVVQGARRVAGPLVMWQKDDRVWLELMPQQLGQPFLLSPKIRTGIGEGSLLGGLMAYSVNGAGGIQVVEFVRVHNTIRLQARNTDVFATPGTPEARTVASAFSASLMGATPVASQPHPERKSILIDAGSLFLSDMLGVGMQLQRMFRQGYSLERGNTVITAVRGSADASVIETLNHYFTGSVSTFPAGPFGGPMPSVPRFLPDSRSMLVGHHYSLSPLPAMAMPVRLADARLGHFTSTVLDFSDDLAHTPRKRMINRWRLEKKDPAAESSEPVKPITFWIDRNVPLQYRDTIKAAILEWNKAFDRIGYRNAIVVQQQADDATFDTLDMGYASVRWMSNADAWFSAIGPSHVDPRTGEILDADVAIESITSRGMRAARTQVLASRLMEGTGAAVPDFAQPFSFEPKGGAAGSHTYCVHGQMAGEQLGYALDVLDARGQLEGGDAVTQQFVLDHIKDTVMHEIGHALGLRHNFRASRAYSEAQLADPEFTRANGVSGSVMEYAPVNLAAPGKAAGLAFQNTLGPYDYWAIEYAYRELPATLSKEQQEVELLRIASRSSEPLLAYGSDEDSFFGLDPETVQWDLGADPLAFAAKRLAIAQDLFKRQETRVLPGDRDYAVLRRSLGYALSDVYRSVGVLVRHFGGLRTLRDHPGSGRDPLVPVTADVQRAALTLISRTVLSIEGLAITPSLQRRLAPDFLDRLESAGMPTDYAVPQRLLDLQRAVLAYLLSDTVAARVLDSASKFDRANEAFQLSELYTRLSADVWSELANGAAFTVPRRELQRDHATRLSTALLRPSVGQRADARSLMRQDAQALLARIDTRLKRAKTLDAESRAHLLESAEMLRQALQARVVRVGV
jgi:Met-zincin/Domain of unknown function (DUF5117)